MPWAVADVSRHNKKVSDEDKPTWVRVANDTRNRCIKKGGTEQMCDALAIATANKVLKESKEVNMDPEDILETIADLEEAVWSAAFINDLPDSSFLYIESGGEKDEGGKTKPRSLRHFPVKDAEGKVDVPHLRNALARIPQSKVDESAKNSALSKAKSLAKKHLSSYKESDGVELESDVVPLIEKAITEDGQALIKVISPGWGSSGYYSADTLKRDAGVYKEGTKMYWDHPTKTEARERPERSLRDLAGELTEDGKYIEDGPTGPGVYAKARVFDAYKPAVEELAPHIGTSHRATGVKKYGEAEGKKGNIIERIMGAASVDFVTQPGRGGEIVQLFEAAREKAALDIEWEAVDLDGLKKHRPDVVESLRSEIRQAVYGEKEKLEEVKRMTEEQVKELEEAKTKLEGEKAGLEEKISELESEKARLNEAVILREAKDFVSEKVSESELPDITKARLIEFHSRNPVLDEQGALDEKKYTEQIDEAIKTETDYIAKLTGIGDGRVKGMGSTQEGDGKAKLKESFKAQAILEGMSEEEAEKYAEIAVRGR